MSVCVWRTAWHVAHAGAPWVVGADGTAPGLSSSPDLSAPVETGAPDVCRVCAACRWAWPVCVACVSREQVVDDITAVVVYFAKT